MFKTMWRRYQASDSDTRFKMLFSFAIGLIIGCLLIAITWLFVSSTKPSQTSTLPQHQQEIELKNNWVVIVNSDEGYSEHDVEDGHVLIDKKNDTIYIGIQEYYW